MSERWMNALELTGVQQGDVVVLEPLAMSHLVPLAEIGCDDELWRWTVTQVRSVDEMRAYLEGAIRDRERGVAFPYTIIERSSGKVAGCTRYGNLDEGNRRLEIGWTWVARAYQRTAVNTEAKYLLLKTAFARLDCIRVEFKTDVLNERSRAALRRLGAQEEGVLRQHMITATGRIRDTVYYSIVAAEWPAVSRALEAKLRRE